MEVISPAGQAAAAATQRTAVSLNPGLEKQVHSRLGALSQRKRGQKELRAELGCRQQNCLALFPNITSTWISRFLGLWQLYRDNKL